MPEWRLRYQPHLRARLHGQKSDRNGSRLRGHAGSGLVPALRQRGRDQPARRRGAERDHLRFIAERPLDTHLHPARLQSGRSSPTRVRRSDSAQGIEPRRVQRPLCATDASFRHSAHRGAISRRRVAVDLGAELRSSQRHQRRRSRPLPRFEHLSEDHPYQHGYRVFAGDDVAQYNRPLRQARRRDSAGSAHL